MPGAANRIGQVTRQTLDAIAFPTFVAELIRGTFDAITTASIKQMEAYGRLLGDVGHTVDDFMNQNISDNQARDWLVQSYPTFLRIERSGVLTDRVRYRCSGRSPRRPASWAGAQAASAEAAPRTDNAGAVFHTGDDVIHASLGEGVVLGTEPGGIVVVRFAEDGKERKLMADYAPIRKR